MTIFDISVGDEIGGTRIVFIQGFFDKSKNLVYLFIGIDKRYRYRLFRHDSSESLYDSGIIFKKLKNMILEVMEIIKTDCRLNHKPKVVEQRKNKKKNHYQL